MKIRSGDADQLGSKGAPNADVRAFQAAMGLIVADGIYGPATRARGKELLGREFPVRERRIVVSPTPITPTPIPTLPAPEPPAPRSPQDAALALLKYIQAGGSPGTKAAPAEAVRSAQAEMGGLVADGIYGPKTRSRGKALTGKSFPPR